MNRTQITACAILCFVQIFLKLPLLAQQNNPLINSRLLLKEGEKLHDEGKYKEAVRTYQKIPKSDTNYKTALDEMIYSNFTDSNYAVCLPLIEEGMKYFPEKTFRWLNHKANVLDDMGKSNEALIVYDTLIAKFPNNVFAWFNKGITLVRMERYDDAIPYFQQTVLIDPYYSSAHYQLGRISYLKGNFVQAMFSFMTNLLVKPANGLFKNSITYMASVSEINDEAAQVLKKYKPSKSDNFEMVQEIVTSKIALDRKYKALTKLDDKVIRQIQVIVEKTEFNASDKGFWMQYYVPMYKQLFNEDAFEPMANFMFSNLDIDEIKQYNKRNDKQIEKMATEVRAYFDELKATRTLELNKRANVKVRYHYSENVLIGKGEMIPNGKDVLLKGPWQFYHANGALQTEGVFSAAGLKEGEWNYYYDNGRMKEKSLYKNGKANGFSQNWHDNGLLYTTANYKNDEVDGLKKNWYYNGVLAAEQEYKNGQQSGIYKKYTTRGFLNTVAGYVNDKQTGKVIDYYNSGAISGEGSLIDGEFEGVLKTYFENGKLKSEGAYSKGEKEGIWKTYFNTGKIEFEENFIAGELDGEKKEYYANGILFKRTPYKKGKNEGKVESFDEDGKIFSDIVFEKGRLKDVNFYDKKGTVISSASSRRGDTKIAFLNAAGSKTSEGNYSKDGSQQGIGYYFFPNGKVSVEANYKDGFLNGNRITYYANGAKLDEVNYTDDELDGYYKQWYPNGKMKEEGWYVEGQRQGTHLNYNALGDVYSKIYYLNDDQYGFTEYYYPNGKLDYIQRFDYDWITAITQYDTTGKAVLDVSMLDGNSDFKFMNYNGKTLIEGKYRKNFLDGEYKSYYGDGSIKFINYYKNGYRDSLFTYNYPNGKLFYQGSYKLGDFVGVWKYYHDNGQPNYTEEYKDGEQDGVQTIFNSDGTKDKEITYFDGQLHGAYKQYGDKNQLAIVLYYVYGDFTAYSYEGADGKLVTPVVLPKGTGTIKAFYKNGKPSYEAEYLNGLVNGKRIIYTSTGSVLVEGKRIMNEDEGEKKIYYYNGQLQKQEFYVHDDFHGVRKIFYENGKPQAEENWYNGDLNGQSKYYDATGKLIEIKTYYYGQLQKTEKK